MFWKALLVLIRFMIFFKVGVASTTSHVKKCPLRSEDIVYFLEARNRLCFTTDELSEKRKCQHEEYVLRPRQHVNSLVVDLFDESKLDQIIPTVFCLSLRTYIC